MYNAGSEKMQAKSPTNAGELDRRLGLFFGDVAERFKALVSQTSGDSGKGCAPVGSNPIISAITAPQLH